MNYSKGRKIYIIVSGMLVAIVAGIIFGLSAQTAKESSGTSDSLINLIFVLIGQSFTPDFIRTVAHLCEFAGFGFLVCNFIFSLKYQPKPLLSIIVSFTYSLTDEIHQLFVPGRAFQLIDLAVDLGGIISGVAAFCIILITIQKLSVKNKKI